MASVRTVREAAGIELTPPGSVPELFVGSSPGDRQILADAAAVGAAFLVTEDVDDFGAADLGLVGLSAVNPDLFLARCATTEGYRLAVATMSASMTNPPRSPEEVHRSVGRIHPLAAAAHGRAFASRPESPSQRPPATLFRGVRCLCCRQTSGPLAEGVCPSCNDNA
jgi:hypothetical protein